MSTSHRTFEGECHCGAIGYVYLTAIAPESWNVRACQCSFCRAHAVRTTSDPSGSVQFTERLRGALHPYRFGQMTADFLVCRTCGVYVGASIATRGVRFLLVAWLFKTFGPALAPMIEKRIGIFALLFVVILVGGFIAASMMH